LAQLWEVLEHLEPQDWEQVLVQLLLVWRVLEVEAALTQVGSELEAQVHMALEPEAAVMAADQPLPWLLGLDMAAVAEILIP
jgi:hypothetical protein